MLNETNTEQESTIELLISTLKEQYCRAERMMSLRDSGNHADEIKQLCADIELNFSKLMSLMKTIGADQCRIDEISKSNVEFDARSKDWMTERAISATSLFRPSGRSLILIRLPGLTKAHLVRRDKKPSSNLNWQRLKPNKLWNVRRRN